MIETAGGGGVGAVAAVSQSNTRSNIKIAKLQIFDETAGKFSGFLTAYKLFIRISMREAVVEEQIQCVLLYIYRGAQQMFGKRVFWKT